jgi:hypothetical protein
VHRHRSSVGQHRGSAAKRDSMKMSPSGTPTYKISALRQLHPLVGRRPHSRLELLVLGSTRIARDLPIDTVIDKPPKEFMRK